MNIRKWPQYDFSLGVQDATTWLLKKPNELNRGINLRFTETVGGFERRPGFVMSGSAGNLFTTNSDKTPLGGHIAKFSTGSVKFVAVNDSTSTATIIRKQNTDGTWSVLSGLPTYPANSIMFFKDYLDEVYVSGFDPVTGNPIQPININKDLNVSTTRNLLNCPWGYFFQDYLGVLYLANVLIGSDRFKDRVYKASPPLGAVTYVQGAQEDISSALNLVDKTPTMTAASTPSGVVLASSEANSSNAAWMAFDDLTTDRWLSLSGSVTNQWLRYDFGSGNAKTISHYSITPIATQDTAYTNRAPKSWIMQGSNDGTSFTDLDTRTNQTTWGVTEKRAYVIATPASYRYYRLYISANQGATDFVEVSEMELMVSNTNTQTLDLKVDSVRYLKPGMSIDIYQAGTDSKLFDITIDGVNKSTNVISFTPETQAFSYTAVSVANDTLTLDASNLITGSTVKLAGSGTAPTGLSFATLYYAIKVDASTIKLATTYDNALLANAINITAQGTGTHRLRRSYSLGDNDEIWLDGTKGKLSIFWNTDYPTPQDTGEFLTIKPGTDAAPTITGIGASSNRLFIWTRNSGTRWDGQNLVTFNNSVGCISHRSIANIDDDWIIWVDAKGNIRARNETNAQQENIGRAIRNQWMRKLTLDQLKATAAGIADQTYKLYLGTINSENIRVCYDFDANTWSPERLGYPALMQSSDDSSGTLKPYFFSNNGKLYMDESGDMDDDKNIAMEAGTGQDMLGTEQVKRFYGMKLFTRNCNGLRLQVAVDGGDMKTIGRIEGTVCFVKFPEQGDSKLPLGVTIDWQIMGVGPGEAPKVDGAVIYWIPEEDVPSEQRRP
jgi:hypothetical protein